MTIERPVTHDDPAVSVVVPTIPSRDHSRVVADLRAQTADAYEVLVVDDAELDICEARNAGIEAASAPVVALTDDDCRPDPEWVERIQEAFEADEDLVLLEGAVRGGRTYDGERKYVGCNLAFRRDAALSVGGFSSEYAGWRDDTEFGWRMERDADGRCAFSAEVVMDHPNRTLATIDETKEDRLKREYNDRYREILVPDGALGRINNWLWRRGFWTFVDKIRYGENTDPQQETQS